MNAAGTTIELQVASFEKRSVVNGPGERAVLWLQGCPFRCRGCFNPDFLPFTGGTALAVAEVADRILQVPGLEGVTFSGGEPMAQAQGLYALCQLLRAAGLGLMSWSGYTLAELAEHPDSWVAPLLGCLDILVDGRFDETQRANLLWRGSRNQCVHFLTPRYRHWQDQVERPGTDVELIVGRDGFAGTGIFTQTILRRLEWLMREDRS